MDGYLQCLIRRLSGQFYSHTIQPPARMRANLYDPFENTAVRPLQYPESQTNGTPAPADHMEKASSDIRYPKSDDPQLPVIGPPGVSFKTGSKRVDKGDLSSSIHLKDRELLKSAPPVNRDSVFAKSEILKQRAAKNDTHLLRQPTVLPTAETEKQKIEPSGKRPSSQPTAKIDIKAVAVRSEKPLASVDRPFRGTDEEPGDLPKPIVKPANLSAPPERIELNSKPAMTPTAPPLSKRRSATRAAKETRLYIGHLMVDVVPVSESFRRRSTSRVRKTMVQKQSKSRKNIGVFILDIYRPISNKDLKHFQEMNHSVKS